MAFRRSHLGSAILLVLPSLAQACGDGVPPSSSGTEQPLPGQEALQSSRHETLQLPAQVAVDREGLPHIRAGMIKAP